MKFFRRFAQTLAISAILISAGAVALTPGQRAAILFAGAACPVI